MNSWKKPIALLAATAAATVTAAVVANAATVRPLTVSGTQTVVDENKGIYKMQGSLIGTWYITSYVPRYQSQTQLAATGNERFVGCFDTNRNASCDAAEPTGTLTFTYMYWARFKNGGKSLVTGACVHPVLGGTKGFAHAKGVVFMKDTPVGATVRTTYTGTLELAGSKSDVRHSERSLAASPRGGSC